MLTILATIWLISAIVAFISGLVLALTFIIKIAAVAMLMFMGWVIWKVVCDSCSH